MKQRALVVHTGGGLGDVLLSSPVLDTLDAAGFEVDFLARKQTAPAIAHHQKLQNLLTIDSKDPRGIVEIKHWSKKLKDRDYQVCFLLWSTSRWAWTLYLSGIPHRVGQDSRLLYSFLFTHKVRIKSEHGDETTHWTDILLDFPRAYGLETAPPVVEFPVSDEQRKTAQGLINDFDFGPLEGPLIGFHTGKGLPLGPERWPVERFGQIASSLQSELQARLVLTGGPSEVELVEHVARQLRMPYLNLAGKTDLPTLAAVASECRLFCCPDSGPMHLAAATGTPVVGIYALDEDFPKRWAPFGVEHEIVRPSRPACRPGCRKPTCPDFACYLKVSPSSVCSAAQNLLARIPTQRNL